LSLLSAGCLFWLERLQPLFVALAVGGVAYQGWLISRRPALRRTRLVVGIFVASLVVTLLVLALWLWLSFRYR